MSESIDPNLKAIESAFRALTPAASAIPRDRLLYEAGRRSVKRRHWPILTGVFATSTLLLGLHIATQPEPAGRIVYLSPPVEPARAGPSEMIVSEPRATTPQVTLLPLILRGAPDYLPPDPAARRLTDQRRMSATAFGPAAPLPPPADWLGLPDDAFRKPVKPHPGFGPIQRGDA